MATKSKLKYKVLRPVVPVVMDSGPFGASEMFFSMISEVAMVQHGINFIDWFTDKVENDVPTGELVRFVLIKSSSDNEIIADLGGKKKAETTLGEIWRLMCAQPNGEAGVLFTNGLSNLFYVRDVNGLLRVIDVGWDSDGWEVNAYALNAYNSSADNQVFVRKAA